MKAASAVSAHQKTRPRKQFRINSSLSSFTSRGNTGRNPPTRAFLIRILLSAWSSSPINVSEMGTNIGKSLLLLQSSAALLSVPSCLCVIEVLRKALMKHQKFISCQKKYILYHNMMSLNTSATICIKAMCCITGGSSVPVWTHIFDARLSTLNASIKNWQFTKGTLLFVIEGATHMWLPRSMVLVS